VVVVVHGRVSRRVCIFDCSKAGDKKFSDTIGTCGRIGDMLTDGADMMGADIVIVEAAVAMVLLAGVEPTSGVEPK